MRLNELKQKAKTISYLQLRENKDSSRSNPRLKTIYPLKWKDITYNGSYSFHLSFPYISIAVSSWSRGFFPRWKCFELPLNDAIIQHIMRYSTGIELLNQNLQIFTFKNNLLCIMKLALIQQHVHVVILSFPSFSIDYRYQRALCNNTSCESSRCNILHTTNVYECIKHFNNLIKAKTKTNMLSSSGNVCSHLSSGTVYRLIN